MDERVKRELDSIDVTRGLIAWIESVEAGTALQAGAILLPHLADGIFADSDAARAKFATGFFETNNALSYALFDAGFFTSGVVVGPGPGRLFGTGAKPLVNEGAPQQNRLFLATLPNVGDWLSIQGTGGLVVPYEFRGDSPPTGTTAGRVGVFRGAAAADSRINLCDAWNRVTDAARINYGTAPDLEGFVGRDAPAQTSLLLMGIGGSETPCNVTENLTALADVWDSPTTEGGMLETRQMFVWKTLTINANMLAAGTAIFSTGIQPVDALIFNHNRPNVEAWAIVGAANAVVLALGGGPPPDTQLNDVVTCLAIE